MNYQCEYCDKTFTGLFCFQQHEASEKHKKKVRAAGLRSPPSSNIQIFPCTTCNIQLAGLSSFQAHVNSLEHADIIKKINSENNVPSQSAIAAVNSNKPATSISVPELNTALREWKQFQKEPHEIMLNQQSIMNDPKKTACQHDRDAVSEFEASSASHELVNIETKDQIEVPFNNHYLANQALGASFAQCDVCQKRFSGPAPYKQHIESEQHKKKISQKDQWDSAKKCEICDMQFSGPVPFNDHLGSKGHKKKAQNVEFIKHFKATLSRELDSLSSACVAEIDNVKPMLPHANQQFYCELCKVHTSGPQPFHQHLCGGLHRKNATALNFKNINSQNDLNVNLNDGKINYFYASKDLIICDALQNIEVVRPEDLNIKVFYPEDEIILN